MKKTKISDFKVFVKRGTSHNEGNREGGIDKYYCEPINHRTGKYYSEYNILPVTLQDLPVLDKIKYPTSYITGSAVFE